MSIRTLLVATFLATAITSPAAALEAEVKGAYQERVPLIRVRPPTDVDIREGLPLHMPAVDGEMDYLDPAEFWDITRDLRLHAIDATVNGLFAGSLFFSDYEMDKEPPPHHPRVFSIYAAVDIYDLGTAANPAGERLNGDFDVMNVADDNYDAYLDATVGWGGRLGLRIPLRGRYDAGFHVGYAHSSVVKDGVADLTAPTGTSESRQETSYLRAMADVGARVRVFRALFLRLTASAGWARARLDQDVIARGVYASRAGVFRDTSTGFSWELSPALQVGRGRGWFELGARFTDFPPVGGVDGSDTIRWKTWGLYMAAGF